MIECIREKYYYAISPLWMNQLLSQCIFSEGIYHNINGHVLEYLCLDFIHWSHDSIDWVSNKKNFDFRFCRSSNKTCIQIGCRKYYAHMCLSFCSEFVALVWTSVQSEKQHNKIWVKHYAMIWNVWICSVLRKHIVLWSGREKKITYTGSCEVKKER